MRFQVRRNDFRREIAKAKAEYRKQTKRAALIATDRASRVGQVDIRAKMKSVELGRLERAVGQTSALRKGQKDRDPYGVVFAKGGDKSRAGQALQAYTRGAQISPIKGRWLWYPTPAAMKRINRYKASPGRYIAAGSPLGELKFRVVSPKAAIAFIEKGAISVRTGRARRAPKRRSKLSIPQRRIILFRGIRKTYRAVRFDHRTIMGRQSRKVPLYMTEALNGRS